MGPLMLASIGIVNASNGKLDKVRCTTIVAYELKPDWRYTFPRCINSIINPIYFCDFAIWTQLTANFDVIDCPE